MKNIFAGRSLPTISQNVACTNKESDPADFETAVSATKFGKFNILLYLLAFPAGWTSVFETTTMSYVFPVAQCDLNISLNDKGLLNAITFIGMVSTGFVWGFLCDAFGRKKLMVVGYFLDAFFVIMSSLSQNLTLLLISKFFGGFIINGPFAALSSYLSEFHCAKYRSRVQMVRGTIVSCGTLLLPLLSMGILPQNIDVYLFDHTFELHSWNIYLMVTAIPSLVSAVAFIFMPESPKFLMSADRNQEALEVFRTVYSVNTGKSKESFPIKELIDEAKLSKYVAHATDDESCSKRKAVQEGFLHVKFLCFPPFLKYIFLICLIQSLGSLVTNTLRLWAPQFFQAISDYNHQHNGTTTNLCEMLNTLRQDEFSNTTCFVNVDPSTYMNNIVISLVSIGGFAIAGTLINKLGKKVILGFLSTISGVCGFAIYFSQNSATVLALLALTNSAGVIFAGVMLSLIIDLFPTTLRAIAISIAMMMARSASMAGNLLFPILLSLGCGPPFFFFATLLFACTFLVIFLPNTDLKALE